jgi:hypothetical protein
MRGERVELKISAARASQRAITKSGEKEEGKRNTEKERTAEVVGELHACVVAHEGL